MGKLLFGLATVTVAAIATATPAASQGAIVGPYGVTIARPGSTYFDYTPGGRYYDDTRRSSRSPLRQDFDSSTTLDRDLKNRRYSTDSDIDEQRRCRYTTVRGEGGLIKHVRRCDEAEDRNQKKRRYD
jgi:hypothetical protein